MNTPLNFLPFKRQHSNTPCFAATVGRREEGEGMAGQGADEHCGGALGGCVSGGRHALVHAPACDAASAAGKLAPHLRHPPRHQCTLQRPAQRPGPVIRGRSCLRDCRWAISVAVVAGLSIIPGTACPWVLLRTDAAATARAVPTRGSGCIVLRSDLCRGALGAGGRADLLEGLAQPGPLHLRGSTPPFCSGSVLLPSGSLSGVGASAGRPALASSLPLRGTFPPWETEGAGVGLVLDKQQPGAEARLDQRSRLADARGTHEDLDLKATHGTLAKRRGDKKGGSRSASQVSSSLDALSSPNTKRVPSSESTQKDQSVGENGFGG
jgi:hypothetical protein